MKKRFGFWVGVIAVALGWLAVRSERVVIGIAVSNERRSNFLRLSAGSFSLDFASGGGTLADAISKDQGGTCWNARFDVNITAAPHQVRQAGAKT